MKDMSPTQKRTAEELTARWEDQRQIKNLMGKYAHCLILNRDSEIPDLFWDLSRDDVRLGVNEGWYVGPDAIRGYYDAIGEHHRDIAGALRARFPDELGELAEDELYGIGAFRVNPLACPVIEVADDGKTAIGLWYSQGAYADVTEVGPAAHWTWGYCAADFVRAPDGWRLFRLVTLKDIDCLCGQDWTKPPIPYPALPEFEPLRGWTPPDPTESAALREYYHPERPLTGSPEIPRPYRTFAEAASPCDVLEARTFERAPAHAPADGGSDAEYAAISRVWDVEEIKKLMHRRVYYIAADRRKEELRDLWVSGDDARETASFGGNTGYYVGMKSIEACCTKAEAADGGAGCVFAHPVSTALVRLSGDGKSARGMWYGISQDTVAGNGGEPRASWVLEKIAADFLREPDGWKIWHLVVSVDLTCAPGEDYSKRPVRGKISEDPAAIAFGEPDIPFPVHDATFNWWDDYPAMPRPYAHYSDGDSYGPAGHPRIDASEWPRIKPALFLDIEESAAVAEAFAREDFVAGSGEPDLARRIRNASSSQEVENVKAEHTYLHGRADATGEWSTIWSKRDDCSWAHAFGRMRGFDQVWYGSVTRYDAMAFENWLAMYEKYPEIGGKDPRPLMEASVHTLVTDVIEVAHDGQSARAAYITPGVIHSVLTPMGHRYCNVLWERYGSDFVLEGGAWKYLHEQVCPDLMTHLDSEDWAANSYRMLTDAKDAPPPTLGDPPPVSDPGPLHTPYTPIKPPQDTCPWPEPYETLDADNTYTPPREEEG